MFVFINFKLQLQQFVTLPFRKRSNVVQTSSKLATSAELVVFHATRAPLRPVPQLCWSTTPSRKYSIFGYFHNFFLYNKTSGILIVLLPIKPSISCYSCQCQCLLMFITLPFLASDVTTPCQMWYDKRDKYWTHLSWSDWKRPKMKPHSRLDRSIGAVVTHQLKGGWWISRDTCYKPAVIVTASSSW